MAYVPKKILIADDEEDLTWSISKSLRKENQEYEIICVNSGDAAIKMLERQSFDLLISDIRMPGKDGLGLLSFVQQHYPNMKVIVMSAWRHSDVQDIVKNDSTICYIEKPFEIHDLKETIARALNGNLESHQTRLINLSLKDIVQHNSQKKFDGSLNGSNGQDHGTKYVNGGEVIQVTVDEEESEHTFRDILNWNRFDYDIGLIDPPSRRSIHEKWRGLGEKKDPNIGV
ncbi:MAG: response regulator [candidate division KSB1 bacterium]|nr:response regulator [candidate division KSB1 bacterium]MDZ7334159.1 response regulator [candidate division KSB1 bacterium]MDZ7375914.1 response regulator [candidate division KSB1 bacterium]MDZ7401345.1 response regulator [candidate division KSB1 bacterium]